MSLYKICAKVQIIAQCTNQIFTKLLKLSIFNEFAGLLREIACILQAKLVKHRSIRQIARKLQRA